MTLAILLTGNDELGHSARLLPSLGQLREDGDIQTPALRCRYQLRAELVANDDSRIRLYAH